jgi:DNA-directed RNA polymerase subunit RPC12/RpoP
MVAERDQITPKLDTAPSKDRRVRRRDGHGRPDPDPGAAVIYVCPMHPDVSSTEPARCPDCGMKLVPTAVLMAGFVCPMHPQVTSTEPARCPDCGMKLLPTHLIGSTAGHADHQDQAAHDNHAAPTAHHPADQSPVGDGIEWEDDMVEVNRMTTPANMRWILIDPDTGERNHGIDLRFRVGDQVKIRLINEMDSTTRCTTRSTCTAPAGS